MKMEALTGPFVEGWALGKYSGKLIDKSSNSHTQYGYLKYGKLVHDYKYGSYKMEGADGKNLRTEIVVELTKSVDYFLNGYFPAALRCFDTVIPIPSSRGSLFTIQDEICSHLSKKGFRLARNTVHVKSKGRIATKNIPGLQDRLKSVGARYELGKPGTLQKAKGLLLIDDIYETGATLRTTVEILNKVVPTIPKFFLTICYIN